MVFIYQWYMASGYSSSYFVLYETITIRSTMTRDHQFIFFSSNSRLQGMPFFPHVPTQLTRYTRLDQLTDHTRSLKSSENPSKLFFVVMIELQFTINFKCLRLLFAIRDNWFYKNIRIGKQVFWVLPNDSEKHLSWFWPGFHGG